MNEAMPELLPTGASRGDIPFYRDITVGMLCSGGAACGVLFALLSELSGRTRTIVLTSLGYSLPTCRSACAQSWGHMAVLRLLVALGTGAECAVASALVAEAFPTKPGTW